MTLSPLVALADYRARPLVVKGLPVSPGVRCTYGGSRRGGTLTAPGRRARTGPAPRPPGDGLPATAARWRPRGGGGPVAAARSGGSPWL